MPSKPEPISIRVKIGLRWIPGKSNFGNESITFLEKESIYFHCCVGILKLPPSCIGVSTILSVVIIE